MATASKSTKNASTPTGERFTKATYLKWYREMLLMRKFEEKCGQLYIQQKFGDSVTCTLDKRPFSQE